MDEPLVPRRSSRSGLGAVGISICCFGLAGRLLWAESLFVLVVFSVAFWKGVTRNYYCNPEALAGVEPPHGGQIIPWNVTLVERKYFFQFTKIVDVYDHHKTHIGYFYDINLGIIMRFGFSDAQNRIWFEARYASFLSRFKPIVEYNLQRCDSGIGGRNSDVFQLKELWYDESWFCIQHCKRLFNLTRRETGQHLTEGLIPEANFGWPADARVEFDSTLAGTFRGKMTEPVDNGGFGFRHQWWMWVYNVTTGGQLALAKQHFVTGAADSNFNVLSRWQLSMADMSERSLPNWVVAFLSVLDDIEEEYGTQSDD